MFYQCVMDLAIYNNYTEIQCRENYKYIDTDIKAKFKPSSYIRCLGKHLCVLRYYKNNI